MHYRRWKFPGGNLRHPPGNLLNRGVEPCNSAPGGSIPHRNHDPGRNRKSAPPSLGVASMRRRSLVQAAPPPGESYLPFPHLSRRRRRRRRKPPQRREVCGFSIFYRGALARAGVALAKPLARVLRQGATQRVCLSRRRFTEDGKSPPGKRG